MKLQSQLYVGVYVCVVCVCVYTGSQCKMLLMWIVVKKFLKAAALCHPEEKFWDRINCLLLMRYISFTCFSLLPSFKSPLFSGIYCHNLPNWSLSPVVPFSHSPSLTCWSHPSDMQDLAPALLASSISFYYFSYSSSISHTKRIPVF